MFADIVGSTRLYDSLGDSAARSLIRDRLLILRGVAETHRGEITAEIGDELMCFFDSAEDAAAAACDMHSQLAETGTSGQTSIRIRIGVHIGRLQGTTQDLIGETAKIAQWAARHAKPEQTLMTRDVYDALPKIFQAVSRYVDDETWDLSSMEHMELHELVWDVEAVTAYKGETLPSHGNRYQEVCFKCGGREIVVSENRPVMSVGRHRGNDIVVPHDLASRLHFSVQFSRGRCTVTDNSTNGTFIINDAREKVMVHRETYPLAGSGRVYLGEPTRSKDDYVITYECR